MMNILAVVGTTMIRTVVAVIIIIKVVIVIVAGVEAEVVAGQNVSESNHQYHHRIRTLQKYRLGSFGKRMHRFLHHRVRVVISNRRSAALNKIIPRVVIVWRKTREYTNLYRWPLLQPPHCRRISISSILTRAKKPESTTTMMMM
jgi:transposase